MLHQQWGRSLLHLHIGMGTGPVACGLTLEQFDQPAGLAQLRTDAQHTNGRCHRLGRTVHGAEQVRRRAFTHLLDGQHACRVALPPPCT